MMIRLGSCELVAKHNLEPPPPRRAALGLGAFGDDRPGRGAATCLVCYSSWTLIRVAPPGIGLILEGHDKDAVEIIRIMIARQKG